VIAFVPFRPNIVGHIIRAAQSSSHHFAALSGEEYPVEGPSHVVFGLAGAVVVDSVFNFSGLPLLASGVPSPDHLALKVIYYGFAALGALAPDIDNARSTVGKHAGFVSKGIQHFAGHRTLFHSLLGMALVGLIIWICQYALGLALYHLGLTETGTHLAGGLRTSVDLATGPGVAFVAFMTGYFLHLVADSLTLGGVPWLWPNHTRFGFPPDRTYRFKTGSTLEPIVVIAVAVLVIVGVFTHHLTI
jgi:inner membrane protein